MGDTLTMTLPDASDSDGAALAFEDLYRDCARDLYAYVASLVSDRAAAEDVTSTTFERAYRKRRRYDPGRGSPRAWLFGIARHAALDELRRRGRTASLVADPGDPSADAAFAQVDGESEEAARRATVRAALAALPPRERELIALKFHAGLSNAEIADVLGISETNAGTRVHRALTTLRKACS